MLFRRLQQDKKFRTAVAGQGRVLPKVIANGIRADGAMQGCVRARHRAKRLGIFAVMRLLDDQKFGGIDPAERVPMNASMERIASS